MLTKQENIKWLKLFRPDLTNKQINEYINYIYKHNRIDKRIRQKHHIIPRNYFKYANNITKEQYVLLMKNNIANLTIKQHEYVHKLLGDKKSAKFLSVHKTEGYKAKMKEVLAKEWSSKEYREKLEKNRVKGTINWWKNPKNKEKMKPIQHNNAIKLNASEDFQYNKREKLIFDCLYKLANDNIKIITGDLWTKYKVHNTPNYNQLFTKYAYVMLNYTAMTIRKIIKLGYDKQDIIINRQLTYDFKHWSDNMLESLNKIKLLTFK